MLRAVRFEAKLGFTLHEGTRAPFATLAGLLENIPPARLLDEFQKLFMAGFGQRYLDLLQQHGLMAHLFPATAAHLASEKDGLALRLIRAGLANTDRRVAEDRPVTPMFLFAVLLFGPISATAQRRFETGAHPGQAIAEAVDEVVAQQNRRIGIPKRFSMPMRELLALQPRFQRREGRRALAFLGHPRFRAAYDFLLLRAEAGEYARSRTGGPSCRHCHRTNSCGASVPMPPKARKCRALHRAGAGVAAAGGGAGLPRPKPETP